MSKYITVYFVGSISSPTIDTNSLGDGLMIFYNDGMQGSSSYWTSSTNYITDGTNKLGSTLYPYESASLMTGMPLAPPTNPCKDAQLPEAQFSIKVNDATPGQTVRVSIELSADFENYTSNPTNCNVNKTTINNLGNIISKTLSQLGAGVAFSTATVTCSFFDPVGFYYQLPPFVTNLELAGMGKFTLLEYQIGNTTAIVPFGTDVTTICNIVNSDVLFSVKLENFQINGGTVNWLTGNYSFSIDITSELV